MKKEKIVDIVYTDTMSFMFNRDSWAKFKVEGSFIALGILRAVFDVIFSLAPNKKSALELITMALEDHMNTEEEL